MINFYFEVENGELVRDGLENLEKAIPAISRKRIYLAVKKISTRMRTEPPPPVPGYSRTGKYQKGWPINPTRVGMTGYMIENPVEYAQKVVGDAEGVGQIHTHWHPFADVIQEELGGTKLTSEIEKELTINIGALMRYGSVAVGLATGGSLLGVLYG